MKSHIHHGRESLIEEGIIGEIDWKRWQTFYVVRRRKSFQQIIEALEKQPAP